VRQKSIKLVGLVFGFLLLIFLIQKISSGLITNRTSFETSVPLSAGFRSSVVPWLNFDGRNYLDIILSGYHRKGEMELSVFFPLYPLLVRLMSFNLLLNPIYIGLIISFIFFLLSLTAFYKLVPSPKPIGLLLIFPTSFFFLAYYTESLFLFLTLTFFLSLRKKKYWLAGLICALATSAKITGVALIPSFAWVLFQEYKKTKQFPFPLLISPLGLILYLVYTQLNSGNWFLVFSGQSFWARKFSLLNPITSLLEWAGKVLAGPLPRYDSPFVYTGIVIEFLTVASLIYLVIAMYKKVETSQYLYLLSSLLLILLAGNFSSIHRYVLVMFPIFIYLGNVLHKKFLVAYSLLSLFLLMYLTSLFTKGYWSG